MFRSQWGIHFSHLSIQIKTTQGSKYKKAQIINAKYLTSNIIVTNDIIIFYL